MQTRTRMLDERGGDQNGVLPKGVKEGKQAGRKDCGPGRPFQQGLGKHRASCSWRARFKCTEIILLVPQIAVPTLDGSRSRSIAWTSGSPA
ncbi:hypothetical protein VTH06DRAFT_6346 [Thermothelomyces fergusii]